MHAKSIDSGNVLYRAGERRAVVTVSRSHQPDPVNERARSDTFGDCASFAQRLRIISRHHMNSVPLVQPTHHHGFTVYAGWRKS